MADIGGVGRWRLHAHRLNDAGDVTQPLNGQVTSRQGFDDAALGAAFDLRDPSLTLLLDRRKLPRVGGMAEEGRLSGPVANGLRDRNVVQGDCEPPITTSRKTPVCTARGPGYIVRFSDVLARGGDSVEVYLAVQKFDTPSTSGTESLRFERAYQLARHGDSFEPTQEARVHETATPPGAANGPSGAPSKP